MLLIERVVVFTILCIFLICITHAETKSDIHKNSVQSNLQNVESRRKKTGHYFLHPYHGWHALSWIYWIKVKLIIVAFFVGTAFIWFIQYISKFYRHCPSVEHINYGYYRSLDDPVVTKFLQNLLVKLKS